MSIFSSNLFWLLCATLAIALHSPGYSTQLIGLFAFTPLFILMDRFHQEYFSWKIMFRLLGYCYLIGIMSSVIGLPWMTHSIHAFGNLPYWISLMITGVGYGIVVVFYFFWIFVLPFFLFKKQGIFELFARLTFAIAIDPIIPRFFQWSPGILTLLNFPYLEQTADIAGAYGLNFYVLGCNFLLLFLYREIQSQYKNKMLLIRCALVYLLFVSSGLMYGMYCSEALTIAENSPSLNVVAVQPNFSLAHLSSNPSLAFSTRKHNIFSLIQDSERALEQREKATQGMDTLLVWPESTYPFPYLKETTGREIVQKFVQKHQIYLLLATIDWEKLPNGKRRYYGVSLLINPRGEIQGRYNKIFLIPFGEYIPGYDWFPDFANWLNRMFPNMSQFEAGKEATVFSIGPRIQFSSPICFDLVFPQILNEMSDNGAQFIINLSNLAWFGKTNASLHLEMFATWYAIQHRIPILYISNNGETMFIDAKGQIVSQVLPLFETGSLSHQISFQKNDSFYNQYRKQIVIFFWLLSVIGAILYFQKTN